MRLSNIIPLFLIFATLGLYMFTQITNSSTHHTLISLQARRGLRTPQDSNPDITKVDGNARRSKMQSNSMAKAYDANSNEAAEIVYNIDYHGVTTHPSPTPKHP
ncbi:uncharacterized protein LOC112500759 [Cynara cardunculus var. scolymus]|uniref:Uncharacterized protein n=1 Tax=Cynara cardunculus var. scolymus TaxID=59895 RepID=A0A103Y2N4_CYNCS|nr:uncharacterized protein LOC112500759 [Cynara cardunculus var. scolymus]KVI01418.1 hypothetical protein Ccrd_020309 [Cynara cardunculus var. scolymus]